MSPCNFGVTEENGLSPLRVRKTHRGDAETQSKKDKNNFGERGGGGGNLLLPKRLRCFCRQRHPLRRRTLPLPPRRSPNILWFRFSELCVSRLGGESTDRSCGLLANSTTSGVRSLISTRPAQMSLGAAGTSAWATYVTATPALPAHRECVPSVSRRSDSCRESRSGGCRDGRYDPAGWWRAVRPR